MAYAALHDTATTSVEVLQHSHFGQSPESAGEHESFAIGQSKSQSTMLDVRPDVRGKEAGINSGTKVVADFMILPGCGCEHDG